MKKKIITKPSKDNGVYSDLFIYRLMSGVIPKYRKTVGNDIIPLIETFRDNIKTLTKKPKPKILGSISGPINNTISLTNSYVDIDLSVKHYLNLKIEKTLGYPLEAFVLQFSCRRRNLDWTVSLTKNYNIGYLTKKDIVKFLDDLVSYFKFILYTESSLEEFMKRMQEQYN